MQPHRCDVLKGMPGLCYPDQVQAISILLQWLYCITTPSRRRRTGWVAVSGWRLRSLSWVASLWLFAPSVTVISEIWNPSPIDCTKSSNLIVKKADLTKLLSNWFKHQSILHYVWLSFFSCQGWGNFSKDRFLEALLPRILDRNTPVWCENAQPIIKRTLPSSSPLLQAVISGLSGPSKKQ